MHNAVHPDALTLNKLYDRLAILFHDGHTIKAEHSSSTKDPNIGMPAHTSPSTTGPDATFEDKQFALKVIDHAALRAHCAEALNAHHSQRPDIIAGRRQLDSIHQQSNKAVSRDCSFRFGRGRIDQMPTPPSSDPIDFSTPKTLDGVVTRMTSHKVQSKAQPIARTPYPPAADIQFPNTSRKRSYTQISNHEPDLKTSTPSLVTSSAANSTLECIIRADTLQTARERDQQARARLERQLVDPKHARNLYLSAVSYKHQNRKRETCYIRYKPGSQPSHVDGAGVHKSSKKKTKNKPEFITNRTTRSRLSRRRDRNSKSKPAEGGSTNTSRISKRTSSHLKPSSNKFPKQSNSPRPKPKSLPQSIILPSDTEDDAPLKLSSPTQRRKWKRLVARITRKHADYPSTVDIDGSHTSSSQQQQQQNKQQETKDEQKDNKTDVVQEVYDRVKRKRIERAGMVLR